MTKNEKDNYDTKSKLWKIIIELIWIFIKDKKPFSFLLFALFFFFFNRGITLVCLNCDFLADVTGLDNMATHLSQHETHTCQVVVEKGTCIYNCVTLDF